MLPILSSFGRRVGLLPPEVEAALEDDARIGELEGVIQDAAPLYGLLGHPGWKVFMERIGGMDAALTRKLKKAPAETVALIQAQLALLEDVANLVPKALEESKLAREELDGME